MHDYLLVMHTADETAQQACYVDSRQLVFPLIKRWLH